MSQLDIIQMSRYDKDGRAYDYKGKEVARANIKARIVLYSSNVVVIYHKWNTNVRLTAVHEFPMVAVRHTANGYKQNIKGWIIV